MNTDPISDMLTRIRNASAVKKPEVVLPYSNMKYSIAKILEREGYVGQVEKTTDEKFANLRIELKYKDTDSVITKLNRVSKPGRRVYSKYDELPNVLSGMGMAIVSTPNGLMTNKEARKRHLGGEVICEIY
jgi:small subunit ribosomal protein S8